MGFFDTLAATLGGGTGPQDPRVHRAKYLEWDFYNFAQYWIVPGGDVHSSEIVKRFQAGVQAKYNGEEKVTDLECLQLLSRWNERYAKAKWNEKGRYFGFQLNPAALEIQGTQPPKVEEESALKKKRKKKKKVTLQEGGQNAQAAAVPQPMTAVFTNSGKDPRAKNAELFYETTRWGNLGHGDPPVSVGSFPGHRWFVKVGDTVIKEFVIGNDEVQEFVC